MNNSHLLTVINSVFRVIVAVSCVGLIAAGCKPTLIPINAGSGPPPGPSSNYSALDSSKNAQKGQVGNDGQTKDDRLGYQRYMPAESDDRNNSTSSSGIAPYSSNATGSGGSTYGGSIPSTPSGSSYPSTPSYSGSGGMSSPYGGTAPTGGSPYAGEGVGSSPYSGYSPGR